LGKKDQIGDGKTVRAPGGEFKKIPSAIISVMFEKHRREGVAGHYPFSGI